VAGSFYRSRSTALSRMRRDVDASRLTHGDCGDGGAPDDAAKTGGSDALEPPGDGTRDRVESFDHRPHLAPAWTQAPSESHFQNLQRSALCRETGGHRRLYLAAPEHALVLCCDEKSQVQGSGSHPAGPADEERPASTFTHDYVRHGTTTLFAALNVADGTVIGQCQARHRHIEWLKFLRLLDEQTPADRDSI